jgi:type II secretory pathway component PulC
MKTLYMKRLVNTIIFAAAALIITSAPLNASAGTGNGEKNEVRADAFELKQIDKDKVMISCDLVAEGTEYYEIERSENNKDFATVCVVFPAGKEDAIKNAMAMKDKIKTAAKTFYYRLKKITGDVVSYSTVKSIQLQ